jgi:peptidoglycan/xylan/chitin deacetylase (PgdA/CDA1 family)
MNRLAKKFLSKNLFLPFSESRRCIFLYHDISDENEEHFAGNHYSTTVDNFKKQINFLRRKFEIIPLENLITDFNLSQKKHYASIAFDDGFFSVADKAFKILSADKIPFALFVNKTAMLHNQLWVSNLVINKNNESYLRRIYQNALTELISYKDFVANPVCTISRQMRFDDSFKQVYLDSKLEKGKKVYLSAEDVKYLHREGVLIGSHTTDEYLLNRCSEAVFIKQVCENKLFLSKLLGASIDHFAIPFGKKQHYNSDVIKKIFAIGHKYIYTTGIVPFKTDELLKSNFLIPRFGMLNGQPEDIMCNINRTFLKKYNL